MLVQITILLILVTVAAYTDAKENKVRNKHLLPALIIGYILAGLINGFTGLKYSFLGMIIPFIGLFPLYMLKFMGAGDIKLYCVIGAIMGYKFLLENLLYTFIVGGILAVIMLITGKKSIGKIKNIIYFLGTCLMTKTIVEYPENNQSKKMPFAIAIFIGTITQLVVNFIN